MPKSIFVDPEQVRKSGKIEFTPIDVNRYDTPFSDACRAYTQEELIGIYRDMYLIRAFETLLFEVKKYHRHGDREFRYDGPLHLSLGQEACAVGQAFLLTPDDFVFGSHRSHGETLAKGLSAIRKMDDGALEQIMDTYDGGDIRRIVSADRKTVKEEAEEFLLYGVLAEILARITGFQRGLSGSMHAFFPPFGVYPNNAIVGASAPIAVGAALYKKVNRRPGIVVSNVGDGALGRGPVWEAMNFAAMDQFNTLWEEAYRGGLPVLFNFVNNFYGMGGQTVGETMAFGQLARIGAGISPTQLHAERVDGSDPLAVIDAMRRKTEIIRNGQGPALLDVITYRTPDEIRTWMKQDPIAAYHRNLVSAGIADEETLRAVTDRVDRTLDRIFSLCADPDVTPIPNAEDGEEIKNFIFSNQRIPVLSEGVCETTLPKGTDPRSLRIAQKARAAQTNGGAKPLEYRDAVFEAVRDKFYEDPTLAVYGEEVRDWGGPYGVYEGLTEAIPYHRFFNAPISESTIVSSAVGYAMAGGRAVVELPFCDFMGCASDEIFNQLSKWQFMSAGHLKMPVVLRIAIGSLYGTQHAQDFSAIAAHVPGLKILYPATPYDAKGLLTAALNGTDPVICFEPQELYGIGEQFRSEGVPAGSYEIPIGLPDVKRTGSDLTILTVGAALYTAVEVADELEKYGRTAEIVDARCLVPFDYAPLLDSVRKTGRLLLLSRDVERGSFIKEIAQTVTEELFDVLKCAPVTCACRNWIAPTTDISKRYFPDVPGIVDLIHRKLFPLNCYVPLPESTDSKTDRSAKGV